MYIHNSKEKSVMESSVPITCVTENICTVSHFFSDGSGDCFWGGVQEIMHINTGVIYCPSVAHSETLPGHTYAYAAIVLVK